MKFYKIQSRKQKSTECVEQGCFIPQEHNFNRFGRVSLMMMYTNDKSSRSCGFTQEDCIFEPFCCPMNYLCSHLKLLDNAFVTNKSANIRFNDFQNTGHFRDYQGIRRFYHFYFLAWSWIVQAPASASTWNISWCSAWCCTAHCYPFCNKDKLYIKSNTFPRFHFCAVKKIV